LGRHARAVRRVAGLQRQDRRGRKAVGAHELGRQRAGHPGVGDGRGLAGVGDPAQRIVLTAVVGQHVLGRARAAQHDDAVRGMAAGQQHDVRLVHAQHRHQLLAKGTLERGHADVALRKAREPLDTLEEPLHPVFCFAPVPAAAGERQVIRACAPQSGGGVSLEVQR
jgi:hypothetical protein